MDLAAFLYLLKIYLAKVNSMIDPVAINGMLE